MMSLLLSAVTGTYDLLWTMENVSTFQSTLMTKISDNPYLLILLILLALVIYYSSLPLNKIRDVSELGFDYFLPKSGKINARLSLLAHQMKQSKDLGELPPVYPNGWIPLLESMDLKANQTKPVTALGKQLVVFRGKTGQIFVLDAYCPHLGAHLGVGGKVYGDCIQCPFHGWRFSGHDGSCVRIPYTDKIPGVAKINTWPTMEENGFIFFWYHAEGLPPSWKLPVIPEISQGLWKYIGRAQHTIKCHIQEITENGADFAHLNEIHQASILTKDYFHPDKGWKLIRHVFSMLSWTAYPEPDQHLASIRLKVSIKVLGISLPFLNFKVHAKQIGPTVVYIYIHTVVGSAILTEHITPEHPLQQKFIHNCYFSNSFSIIGRVLLWLEICMVDRDVVIWNNKKYMKSPILVSEEKSINKYRKWYSQFYSQNSPRLKEKIPDW